MGVPLPDDARDGVRDTLPLLVGMAPFALVAVVAGVEAGLTPLQTLGMSVLVFAGASQLAARRTGSVVWTLAAGMTGLHAARFLL